MVDDNEFNSNQLKFKCLDMKVASYCAIGYIAQCLVRLVTLREPLLLYSFKYGSEGDRTDSQ